MSRTPSSNPGDENTYEHSFTMHKLIWFINTVAFGLLQVLYQFLASTNYADHRATFVSYYLLIMTYAVLLVSEVKLKRNQDPIHHFVRDISHLFGTLAALVLVSIFDPIFALTVAPLWLAWLIVVMYIFLAEFTKSIGPDLSDIIVEPSEAPV